jgi:hypothetical protein
MSELSTIGKIMKALELAKVAQTGVELTYFDVIELLGYLKSLEETIGLFEEERDALKEAGRWIPVGERLPEIHDSVLIFDGCMIEIGHNEAVNTPCFFEDKENSFRQNITYWQPLPQPPEVNHE